MLHTGELCQENGGSDERFTSKYNSTVVITFLNGLSEMRTPQIMRAHFYVLIVIDMYKMTSELRSTLELRWSQCVPYWEVSTVLFYMCIILCQWLWHTLHFHSNVVLCLVYLRESMDWSLWEICSGGRSVTDASSPRIVSLIGSNC